MTHAYITQIEPEAAEGDESSSNGDDETEEGDGKEDVADVDAEVLFKDVQPADAATVIEATCRRLSDMAFVASIQSRYEADMAREMERMREALAVSNEREFCGIVIDTACTGTSVISADEHSRYCRDTGAEFKIDAKSAGYVSFGDSRRGRQKGRVRSFEMATVRGAVDTLGDVFEIQGYVAPGTDTPCLLSMQVFGGLGYKLRTGSNTLWSQSRDSPREGEYPIGPHKLSKDGRGHAILDWQLGTTALFITAELKKLHRAYGHESAQHIVDALREAGYYDLPADTKRKLEEIFRTCGPCQTNPTKPKQFSISLKWRNCRLNHRILVGVMSTSDGDVIYVYDRGTRYHAAKHTATKKNPNAAEIWAAIKLCWIDVYMGLPDILQFDQGTSMVAFLIQTACALNAIRFEAVPVEAAWRMGAIEHAHAPLRKAYNKLRSDLPSVSR